MYEIHDKYLVFLFDNCNLYNLSFSATVHNRSLNITNLLFIIQRRNFITTQTYKFSTTKISYQKKSLDKDFKKEVVQDIKEYDQNNPRPVHVNPGYPNLDIVVKKSVGVGEFLDTVDKFIARNSVQNALQEQDQECKRYVVQKWAEKHPEVPSHKVATYIDKKQESQYVRDDFDVNFGINKKESSWIDKLRSRATIYPDMLPSWTVRSPLRRTGSDSGAGSDISLPTPSVQFPPTKTDSTQAFPSEASSSSQASSSSSKESKIDFVMEKQACEMPNIIDADGGD